MINIDVQFFYRKDTLQIDAVFIDCKTGSTLFKNPSAYVEVNVTDPPYPVTRNHRVILGDRGNVIKTEPNPNPLQPVPAPAPGVAPPEKKKPWWRFW